MDVVSLTKPLTPVDDVDPARSHGASLRGEGGVDYPSVEPALWFGRTYLHTARYRAQFIEVVMRERTHRIFTHLVAHSDALHDAKGAALPFVDHVPLPH
eukprot:8174747-Pyramimonas_sp.AAC.1